MNFWNAGSLLLAGILAAAPAAVAQTAGQDMKNAGNSTKNAAEDTGHATAKVGRKIGHGTKVGARKVGHGTKKAAVATKNGTENLGDKIAGKPAIH